MTIEQFATSQEHTIAMLEAISTLFAVVIALVFGYLAYRTNRTRIRALAYDSILFEAVAGGAIKHRYFMISVTNLGMLPVTISDDFFLIRMLLSRRSTMIVPADESPSAMHIPSRDYPVTIQPRKSERFIVCDRSSFVSDCRQLAYADRVLGDFRLWLLRIYVVTDDGIRCKANIHPALRSLIGKR